MRLTACMLMTLLAAASARAWDSTLVWNAEVRMRGEADGRDFNNKTPLFGYSVLRTRLGVQANPSPGVHAFIQVQDGRLFGEEQPPVWPNTTVPQSQFLDLHQAYLQLERVVVDELTLQLGRMELSYGDERLVGRNDWGEVGQAFDAVRLGLTTGGHSADLFFAKIVRTTTLPDPVGPFTVVQPPDQGFLFSGLWYRLPDVLPPHLAVYFFHEWDMHEDLVSRGTIGVFAEGTMGRLLYGAEGAYQGGEVSYTGVSAFMVRASAGYVFPGAFPDTVRGGIQYLSGTGAHDQTNHTFSATFASRHDVYGAMDYFGNPSSGTNGRGLQDIYLRLDLVPSSRFSLSISLHHLQLVKPWNNERALGQEVDVRVVYSTWASAALEAGMSGFRPDDVMKAWYNHSDLAVWGYVGAKVWL